jgi:hypothetical protein
MEDSLMSLKATNGTIVVYEDRVVIVRKGLGSLALQGIKGDRTFFYSDLSGVEYKKPSIMANGYMKFLTSGTLDINAKVGIFGSSKQSGEDPNTVILRAFDKKVPIESEKIYNFLMKKISDIKKANNNSSTGISSADEILKFKNLLENGIISEEEFEAKKKQLLGI